MECNWCHDPVSEEQQLRYPLYLRGYTPVQRRYIEETWSTVPEMLCATDFLVLATQVISATSILGPAAL